MADTLHSIVLIGPVAAPSGDWAETAYAGGPTYGDTGYAAPASAYAAINADPLPTAPGTLFTQTFLYDFYFRIWIIPGRIDVRNPQVASNIPFSIWNAYPESNDLTAINTQGADDVTLDIAPVSTFFPIEYRELNIQVNEGATGNILALFDFIFEQGHELFTFSAINATIVPIVPEVPVEETWQWLTDVQVSDNGKEQRIALRGAPRRMVKNTILATEQDDVYAKLDQLLNDLQGELYIPYFQYATPVTEPLLVGETLLTFSSVRTDLREGDFALLFRKDGQYVLVQMATVTATGGTIDSPIPTEIPAGSMIVPAFTSLVDNQYAIRRRAIDRVAQFDLDSTVLPSGRPFADPNTTAVVNTFDGYDILDKRPLAGQPLTDVYDTGATLYDFDTGVIRQATEWAYSRMTSNREWVVKRVTKPQDLEWWRAFLARANGQQKPFLIPTWRNDLELLSQPLLGATSLILVDSRYSTVYDGAQPYQRLRITTSAGTHDCTVGLAAPNDEGNDVIYFLPALPATEGWDNVLQISFLHKVRLANDQVRLQHYALDTVLRLTIRTVDE